MQNKQAKKIYKKKIIIYNTNKKWTDKKIQTTTKKKYIEKYRILIPMQFEVFYQTSP